MVFQQRLIREPGLVAVKSDMIEIVDQRGRSVIRTGRAAARQGAVTTQPGGVEKNLVNL